MDLITDLPLVNGLDSILVVVDQGLSKGVILLPCSKTLTADGAGQLLLDNLYKRFGLPDSIISDRGPQFAAKSFQELLKLLNVNSRLSTAYHPQTVDLTRPINNKKSFIHIIDDKNNLLIDQLENEIKDMEREYHFMENLIKTKKLTPIIIIEPPSPTLTIDKILLSLLTDN